MRRTIKIVAVMLMAIAIVALGYITHLYVLKTEPPSAISSPALTPTPNVEVVVSGFVEDCQNGNITFKNPSGQYKTLISNHMYSISVMGGQSYNVTITYQGTQGEETEFATVNVPNYTVSGTLTANFPSITAREGIEKPLT
jgi:type IV secretory pathway component VirB8